jgi:hypothetical protein
MDFLQRQFSPDITEGQFKFDVLFGIFTPILCIAIDKFKLDGIITNSSIFSYVPISITIVFLALWLLFNSQVKSFWTGLVTGVLVSGAIYASVLAILVALFTVWGFFASIALAGFNWSTAGLALLGLFPIITVFVFVRNGFRAFQQSHTQIGKYKLTALVLISVIIMFLLTKITVA